MKICTYCTWGIFMKVSMLICHVCKWDRFVILDCEHLNIVLPCTRYVQWLINEHTIALDDRYHILDYDEYERYEVVIKWWRVNFSISAHGAHADGTVDDHIKNNSMMANDEVQYQKKYGRYAIFLVYIGSGSMLWGWTNS